VHGTVNSTQDELICFVLGNDNLLAENLRERLSALVTMHTKLEQTQLLELQELELNSGQQMMMRSTIKLYSHDMGSSQI